MGKENRDISFKARQAATLETNELLAKVLKAIQHTNKLLEGLQPPATEPAQSATEQPPATTAKATKKDDK